MSDDENIDTLLATYAKKNAGEASRQDNAPLYAISALTASIPAYLFYGVFNLDVQTFLVLYVIGVLVGALGLSYAYQNTSQNMRNKLLSSREEAITLRSVAAEASTRGEKPHNLVRKKKEQLAKVTAKEATAYAIFYNNSLFLGTFLVLARLIFVATMTPINYILSVALAAAVVSFVSTSK